MSNIIDNNEEDTIIDLVISPPNFDIDKGSAPIKLVYQRVQGVVWVTKNEDEEELRERITKHFSLLIDEKKERVAGIYYDRYGPFYPLDVLVRLPSAWSSDYYYLYVVPRSDRIDKITRGELSPTIPHFEIDRLYLTFGKEKERVGKELTSLLRRYGYVRCVLPDRYWNVYIKARKLIEKFFSFPVEVKRRYEGEEDTAYVPDKIRREIFHVHQWLFTKKGRKYLPDDIVEGFGEAIKDLYDAAKDILVHCLHAVLSSLGFPSSYISSLIDEGYEPYDFASSMRLFQYNPVKENAKWSHKLQCFEHADTTLLTFNPCTKPEEVEIVDRASGVWQVAEANASEREVVIFPGVFLGWITSGYIQSPLHRVKHESKERRISTPFFLRCPKDAVLDRSYLDPSILPTAPRCARSVVDFIRERKDVLGLMANEMKAYPPEKKSIDDTPQQD